MAEATKGGAGSCFCGAVRCDTKVSLPPLDYASASDASGTPGRRFSSAWSFQKRQ